MAVAVATRSQSAEPPLAAIKAAAERGDGRAQYQLAEAYRSRSDEANALIWYRKAAAQDIVPSQSKLGRILIGYAKSPTASPAVQAMHAEEAIRWLLKAANQGDKPAQLDLGRQFESGKFLKQDYVEAYKWYAVAAQNHPRSVEYMRAPKKQFPISPPTAIFLFDEVQKSPGPEISFAASCGEQ